MAVLVYVENTDGAFKKSGLEVVSYASALAGMLNTNLNALVIGISEEAQAAELSKYGADKVLTVTAEALKGFGNTAYAAIIASCATAQNCDVVVMSNSFTGKGLAPRVAVKLDAGLVSGAIALPEVSSGMSVKKMVFSGKAFATEKIDTALKVITVNANSFGVKENEKPANLQEFNPGDVHTGFTQIVKDIVKAKGKITLPEAEIVVSAGRGMKGPENWPMIEELADVLGAATACSKPVSDAHWRPHEEHVGQTGITVTPNLYFAIGISGAIQHVAGISGAKTIVAINKDAEAPIFKVADYGIVGDAFEVVPRLTQALKNFKA